MQGLSIAELVAEHMGDLDMNAMSAVLQRVHDESLELGITYQPEGKPVEVTNLVLAPVVMTVDEIAAVREIALVMAGITRRFPEWRRRDAEVRALLQLEEGEERWLADCWPPAHRRSHRVIGRWDMNVELRRQGRPRVQLFEGNGVAIGGLNYAPAAERIVAGVARTVLRDAGERAIRLSPMGNLHRHLVRFFQAHCRRIGRRLRTLGWLEDKTWTAGITEAGYIMQAFERHGVKARLIDPRDLRLVRGEVWHRDTPIDAFYRNIELRDLVDLERRHGRLDAMRLAFRKNQVISSLAGEFDHKSIFHVMALPQVQRRLSASERTVYRACVPWTRLLRAGRSDDPDGRSVDLTEFTRRNRGRLVLKPNRACGGDGVTIGPVVSQSVWDRTLNQALREPGTWVVQTHIAPVEIPYPEPRGRRTVLTRRFANWGVIALPGCTGVLGRASKAPVVNVARGGGIVAILRGVAR
ncbi:MAG: hypothetical protein JXR83_12115 [Deltaproteobacteria bacterium]|nr:hypothetical protein [Deltaproteobacteria bacterium]